MDEARKRVITEATAWIGTPFHHEARLKGVGVDCGQLLIAVYSEFGFIPRGYALAHYPADFALHRDEEWYLRIVTEFAREIEGPPKAGDIVLVRMGRLFSHGGIVTSWPLVIHAYAPAGQVLIGDLSRGPLSIRPMRFFSPFGEGSDVA